MKSTQEPMLNARSSSHPVIYTRLRMFLLSIVLALVAGLVASLATVALMGILRLSLGIPTPVELFGQFILKHIDVTTFIHLLRQYSPNSKTAPLGLALLAMIGIGTALSLPYAAIAWLSLPVSGYRPGRREWITVTVLAILMTLTGVVLFWNEIGISSIGFPRETAMALTSLALFTDFCLYAVVLCFAYRILLPKQPNPEKDIPAQNRRLLLSRAGVAVLGLGSAASGLASIQQFLGSYSAYDGQQTPSHNDVTSPITPNDEHYVVTQNAVDPVVHRDLWRLEVGGLVQNPGSYTFDEVQALPSTSRAVTLECIANEVGAHLMSMAIWQGVTLRTLLERHGGALPDGQYVAFYSVDGYNISLPLKEVLAADAILAWRMNGAELPTRHGFPMRVLIPGRYGEENPKWVTRVELTDHFVNGLYSSQGWYNGPLHTTSRIDRPAANSHLIAGQIVEVGGIAYGGDRGIQMVEVSTDGGATWNQVVLQPALSQDAWVLWTWQWKPQFPGSYRLEVRATDGPGQVQTSTKQGTVPGGATGYHIVQVEVH